MNKKYKWPRDVRVGKSLKSLVARLLEHETVKRLGVAKPVTEHPWLSGIDWKKMDGQRYIVRGSRGFAIELKFGAGTMDSGGCPPISDVAGQMPTVASESP